MSTGYEEAVLGAILVDEDARNLAMVKVKRDDFAREIHSLIFEAVHDLYHKQAPIDRYTVISLLKERDLFDAVGGRQYLFDLAEGAAPWHIDYHIKGLIEAAKLRRLKLLAQEAASMDKGSQEIADFLLHGIDEIQAVRRERGVRWVHDSAEDALAVVEKQAANPGVPLGLRTGFRGIDSITGGLQRSDLIIIAARTSMGKTSLLTTLMQGIGDNQRDGGAVVIFTYEVSDIQLAMKILCAEAGVSMHAIRSGYLSPDAVDRLAEKSSSMRGINNLFLCNANGFTVEQIRAECRRIKNKRGLQAVGIDYIQLIKPISTGRNETRAHQLGEITKGLKGLACEFDIPVIALAQVNRAVETRDIKVPTLADL